MWNSILDILKEKQRKVLKSGSYMMTLVVWRLCHKIMRNISDNAIFRIIQGLYFW